MSAALCLLAGANASVGQPGGGGGVNPACTVQAHCAQLDEDNSWQPGTCEYLVSSGQLVFDYFEYDVEEYTIGQVFDDESGPYDVFIIGTHFCAVADCGDVPGDTTTTFTWSTEKKTCWEVIGGVEAEIGTSLVTKLIAKLEVDVNVGVKWNDCKTETNTLQIQYPNRACWDRRIWKEQGTAQVGGSVEVTASVAHWHTTANGNVYTSECGGTKSASGAADTVRYIHFKNQEEPCCEPPEGEICCGCLG